MPFRTLQALFPAVLAVSAAHGQMNAGVTVPDVSVDYNQSDFSTLVDEFDVMHKMATSVRYGEVVSPETFTLHENVAWAVRSLLRPEETLGNAVIMYGYDFSSACDNPEVRGLNTPAVLAVQPSVDSAFDQVEPSSMYSVTLYETVADACNARRVVQMLANTFSAWEQSNDTAAKDANEFLAERLSKNVKSVSWPVAAGSDTDRITTYSNLDAALGNQSITILGYLPVETGTAASFAQEIGEIENSSDASLIFSVGRLPVVEKGIELWAFCAEVGPCFGHQNDKGYTSSHFAGLVNSDFEKAVVDNPQILMPAAADE